MESKIVFIDGHCIMCNRLAKYVLRHDRNQEIFVSALQGKTAELHISRELRSKTDTVIYLRKGELLVKSSAALWLLADLGGWRKLAKIGFIFPVSFRNWIYKNIAKRRYKWFGRNETCEIHSKVNENRILD